MTHTCLCQYRSPEWSSLTHDDYETLAHVGRQLLAAAPNIHPMRFPVALGAWLNRELAAQRGGPRAMQLKRCWRVTVGRPDDARRLHEQLLAAEVVPNE